MGDPAPRASSRCAPRGPASRRARAGRQAAVLVALLLAGPAVACGGEDAEREAAREELERRFGRRDTAGGATTASGAGGGVPGGDTTPSSPATPGTQTGDPAAEPSTGDEAAAEPPPGRPAEPPAGRDTAPQRPAPTPPPEPGPAGFDPERWLAMADSAYRRLPSLRARFEQRVEVPLLERTNTGIGIWYQRGRDRFRMDFTEPPDDLFVADGTYLWLYQPSQQPDQVIKAELAGDAAQAGTADLLGRILAEARTAYEAAYEGTETVSGVDTHVIALTPRGPSEYRLVRVWIAAPDRLVRRFRIEQENEMVRTVTLAALEPGVPLADSLFRFVVPEGVDVYEP